MRRLLLLIVLALTFYPEVNWAQCHRCYGDTQDALEGRGAGPDGRRIVSVRIEGSFDSSPGQTDDKIGNGITDAINKINNATDPNGNKNGYWFVMDQGGQYGNPAVITITKGSTQNQCGSVLGCASVLSNGYAATVTLATFR